MTAEGALGLLDQQEITRIEDVLLSIWRDVLGVQDVTVDDDIFALGARSSGVASIVKAIDDRLSVQVPMKLVFDHPCARAAARAIVSHHASTGPSGAGGSSRSEAAPLSAGQEGIWRIERVIPGSPFFNVLVRVRFHGRLNLRALVLSLTDLVRRHDVLRAAFHEDATGPRQVTQPHAELEMTELTAYGLTEEGRTREVRRLSEQELSRGFEVSGGPLTRVTLVAFAPDDHALLLTFHHIAFDGWSRDVFLRDFARLYQAHVTGSPADLPIPAMQYSDFARWQRRHYTGDVLDEHLDFWARHVGDARAPLELATGKGKDAAATFTTARARVELTRPLSDAADALARSERTTVFAVLLAGFAAVLRAYSGAPTVRIATLVANREWASTQDVVGLFMNTLALTADVSGEWTFRELVGRVGATCRDAFRHQGLPFEIVLDELERRGLVDRNALLQIGFALHERVPPPVELPGVRMVPLAVVDDQEEGRLNPSTFALTLEMRDSPDGLGGYVNFKDDVYTAAQMAELAGDLSALLERGVAAPDTRMAGALR